MGDISKNFNRSEFASKSGSGFDTVDVELINVLEGVREHFKRPISINSGSRDPVHNKKVGGSATSQHLYGKAVDFVVDGINADEVADYLIEQYEGKYGIGRYVGRTHLDVRSGGNPTAYNPVPGAARWDKR